jgi:hypothetical protein
VEKKKEQNQGLDDFWLALLLGGLGVFAAYQFINGIFTGSILEGGGRANSIAGREIVKLSWEHTPILYSISMAIALATAIFGLLCFCKHFTLKKKIRNANQAR